MDTIIGSIRSNTNSKDFESKALMTFKSDFITADMARKTIDAKIEKWKSEYNGEKYGNEKAKRSNIVSRDIKKQSEWQHPALVEPFISTPDIVKAYPVTWEDRDAAKKIEILLNTQFCRQFNRYNFMNKAIKVLDQEGTCVVRLGWEVEERVIERRVVEDVPNPEYLELQEQAQAIMQELQQLQMILQEVENSININDAQAYAQEKGLNPNNVIAQWVEDNTPPDVKQAAEMYAAQMQELEQVMQQIPPTIEQINIIPSLEKVKNHPTAVVCRNSDIYIDPTCQDNLDRAQFIIYRYETTITELKNKGIYKNLDNIDLSAEVVGANSETYYDHPDKTFFSFKDYPRKRLLLHEYWGVYDLDGDGVAEPIVCCWVGDTIIRFEHNPLPDKKPPFIVVPFNTIPFTLYGESNAELISDIQKMKTAIYRGFIDNMALSNNGQKGIPMGSLDAVNRKRFLNGEHFEYIGNSLNGFYDGHFNELPGSAFNMVQLLNSEAESITGVASYNSGISSNSINGTATGLQGAMDSANSRRLNIVRNISENLVKPLLRKWLAYDSEFLDEQSQVRITNEEFLWLDRADLGANIDIELTISTSDDNKAIANELAFLLQTLGPNEDPNIRRLILSEIFHLYRRPDMAKAVVEYEPQPDPLQQRLAELQAQMLEAQIANEQAKAGENEQDVAFKAARTETEKAKAAQMQANTNKSNLDYMHDYYGTNHNRSLELQAQKDKASINREMLKMLANSTDKDTL